jgi:broad specificity phosphatase PhoE
MTAAIILPLKPFYIVRHGESEANVRMVAAGGGLDSPLTEKGITQARTLASVIHHLPTRPSRIYHSPQIRAKDTAGYINDALRLEMTEIEQLKEHMFGDWENVVWEKLRPLAEKGVNPPNGETYIDFAQRIQNVIHTIFNEDHESPPMMVAHGGVIRSIWRLYSAPIDHIPNCALYHFIPAPHKSPMPWDVHFYEPCPLQGLKKSPMT